MKNEYQIKAKAIGTKPLAKELHVAYSRSATAQRVDRARLLIQTLTVECLQSGRGGFEDRKKSRRKDRKI